LPFFGEAWVGYVPDKKIAGLSKLPRTVEWFSKGLWTQEDLTSEIAVFLEEELKPIGVAVLMTGEHLCMTIRGVESPGVITTTSEMRGCFLDPEKQARMEFYNNVRST
jgi:GTP cyclohydrolase I